MGRKKQSKESRKKKGRNVKNIPIPISPEPKSKVDTPPIELTALDILNILTREHLKKLLEEYELISFKHNLDARIDWELFSCRDLKKGETSRFDQLKWRYFALFNDRPEKAEVMEKGKHKASSSRDEENVETDTESKPIPYGVLEQLQNLHTTNILWFIEMNKYINVGFNKFRYDQCPNVHLDQTIMATEDRPNRALQETMLSLKITNEEMIKEGPKGKDIRILNFRIRQTRVSVEFLINIPEIHEFPQDKIIPSYFDKGDGVGIYVKNHKEKNYVFEISNFANKIIPRSIELEIFGDSLVIYADKKKKGMWQELFHYKNQTKVLWEKEMEIALSSIGTEAQIQMEPMDFIWNVALILVNCETDFLNLPEDLNHINKCFESLDEMIIYYKTMITFNHHLRGLFYILGGALYKRLKMNFDSPSEKDLSYYEKEAMKEVTNAIRMYVKNQEEADSLYLEEKFEEAILYYSRALSFCSAPTIQLLKGATLFEVGRYKESVMDSIFALRNLDLCQGFLSFLIILNYKIKKGYLVGSVDMAISLEFHLKQMNEHRVPSLKDIRRSGLLVLNNIFKSYSLIFQKKYKDAIPFLEKAESIVTIKSGPTSVILLLLYFICKNYEGVISFGELFLENCNPCKDLVLYLLGMSSYYLKQLRAAINYLEKLQNCSMEKFITKIKDLRDLIRKANEFMTNGKLITNWERGETVVAEELVDYYKRAEKLAKDNDQMLAHIWTKLGVLNFLIDNFEESVEFLTSDLTGNNKNIFVVRAETYHKLGMVNEAVKDRQAALNLMMEDSNMS